MSITLTDFYQAMQTVSNTNRTLYVTEKGELKTKGWLSSLFMSKADLQRTTVAFVNALINNISGMSTTQIVEENPEITQGKKLSVAKVKEIFKKNDLMNRLGEINKVPKEEEIIDVSDDEDEEIIDVSDEDEDEIIDVSDDED